MIFGVGCDIVDIKRIDRIIKRWGDLFINRVFSKSEIRESRDILDYKRRSEYFAKRFAAKEAYSKALRIGIGNKGLSFCNIEVLYDEYFAPYININLSNHIKEYILKRLKRKYKALRSHLSMSDEYPYAIAYVVLEVE